jgi:hypothetical protein
MKEPTKKNEKPVVTNDKEATQGKALKELWGVMLFGILTIGVLVVAYIFVK